MANDKVKDLKTEILSNNWYTLKKVTFDLQQADGSWKNMSREAYDRGNGAVILLYNKASQNVILTRQFRLPTYINGNPDGYLIECCAGLLDENNPEDCIRKETEEETGYKVTDVKKIFEAYMSPGSVTEILYFFVAEYAKDMKISDGGGLPEETEHIEVLELPFTEAYDMIGTGEIKDAKTIMLLQYAQLNNLLS
ncbi:GDP-mannose pyrophosphatase NudK [Mucilaginibacter sabulilitoris]|uniref:GDP-mannose pyrophosphatase n=1 Tax=Mucilaginibacter sabulilitoris TaxID=1173583 RepID=A0ABZ0TJ13_9SPHI|nr:GDP-mannose pyrophosphatase NudK [Mucilaginibacter sabulilitoris]WPU92193.1 GDP-mannose pyrophosphatase NudK [Mucilaginibacter sabulilitoris]